MHSLHYPGKRILADLFPGLVEGMVEAGAVEMRMYEQLNATVAGHPAGRLSTGETEVLATRPFLEHHVRGRVRALPNITVMDGCEVAGLVGTRDGSRVTGVEVTRAGGGEAETIAADLVVDAMGRGGRTPQWLAGLGYPAPSQQEMRVSISYTTRRLRLRPGARRLQNRLSHDPVVMLAFGKVIGMERPPATLLAPRVMLRVLAGRRRDGARRPETAAEGAGAVS